MNVFENKEIYLNRIKRLYINCTDINDIDTIRTKTEEQLEYLAEHLMNNFYTQRFIYEIKGIVNNQVVVEIVDNIKLSDIKENMFIVFQ